MSDHSTNVYYSRCMHRHVTTVITGSRRIIDGEVWDDIRERLMCLECGVYVTEEEVRAGWGQHPLPKEEKSHGSK
jgi:hypothetical protein